MTICSIILQMQVMRGQQFDNSLPMLTASSGLLKKVGLWYLTKKHCKQLLTLRFLSIESIVCCNRCTVLRPQPGYFAWWLYGIHQWSHTSFQCQVPWESVRSWWGAEAKTSAAIRLDYRTQRRLDLRLYKQVNSKIISIMRSLTGTIYYACSHSLATTNGCFPLDEFADLSM